MNKPRLANRQLQIPNGLKFYLPEVRWSSPPGASFNVIARALQQVVLGNPALAQQHHWPTDLPAIEDWVDTWNATLCLRMGWTKYVVVDPVEGPLPKSLPPHQAASLASLKAAAARAKQLMAGARTLIEWDESGEDPVSPEQSLKRATICSTCPHNTPGDFTAWFTVPASELIRQRIQKAKERKLETPRDEDLHICDICMCPLKLKVHTPLTWILKRLSPEVLARLKAVPACWVGTEA